MKILRQSRTTEEVEEYLKIRKTYDQKYEKKNDERRSNPNNTKTE